MRKGSLVVLAMVVLFAVVLIAGGPIKHTKEIDNASTEATRPYVEEYTQCTQDRGAMECQAILTDAARKNEGVAVARQVAIDITEYRRAVEQPAETAGEPHAE